MKDFEGKVAVITGGGSGLGRGLALSAARLGMRVVVADIQQDSANAVAEEIRALGAESAGYRVDVSKAEEVEDFASSVWAKFGDVSLLFNNAGVTTGGLVWECRPKDWEWLLGVNVYGVINGQRAFVPRMLAAEKRNPDYEGHIVTTASLAGLISAANMGPYAVSKHAAVALTEALFYDLALMSDRIHCSVLCPSYVPTNIGQSDRSRPADLVDDSPLTLSQRLSAKGAAEAVATGGTTVEMVSDITFDAIREDRFYIYPDEEPLSLVRRRADRIVSAENPSTDFSDTPQLAARGERLRAVLRGESS